MKIFYCLLILSFHFSSYAMHDLINSISKLTQDIKNKESQIKKEVKKKSFSNKSLLFTIKKEHRLLDLIARKIGREFHFQYPSVSVAWTTNNKGKKALVVSFNDRDPGQKRLIKILRSIIKESRLTGNTTPAISKTISELKQGLKDTRKQISNCKNPRVLKQLKKDFHINRDKMDLLKLHLATYPGHRKYNANIAEFFNDINKSNIILLKNKRHYHSELNIINYLLKNNSILGYFENHLGIKTPYQYIGNCMNCCGKCTALINGYENNNIKIIGINSIADKMHMKFFSRGNNPYIFSDKYGRYNIPPWATKINHKNPALIKRMLDSLPSTNNISDGKSFNFKEQELSESSNSDDLPDYL